MPLENKRKELEALYVEYRIQELRLNPVQGNFDEEHLREIHRKIFQDLPKLGFDNVTPGVFRAETPKELDWVKHRKLETIGIISSVAYSAMDVKAKNRLKNILNAINIHELSKLNTSDFIKAISRIYIELDYIHPFNDGNSRTLREFTRQLAEACGYELEWEQFAKSKGGRDFLYIARDLSVNELALPNIQNLNNKRDVLFSMDTLAGNRNLTDLLQDAINPLENHKTTAPTIRFNLGDKLEIKEELNHTESVNQTKQNTKQTNFQTKEQEQVKKNLIDYADLLPNDKVQKEQDIVNQVKQNWVNKPQLKYTNLERAQILQGNPVARLNSSIAPKGFNNVTKWATNIFNQQGNKAINLEIGEIILNNQSVRDSLAHGGKLNPYKTVAFYAIKKVLEKGAVVLNTSHEQQESYYVCAPLLIDTKECIGIILVKKDVNTQRMYLHSVNIKEKLLNYRVSSVDKLNDNLSEQSSPTNLRVANNVNVATKQI